MTLTKLAQLANVSLSTASKALSDSPEISEETKAMVIRLAKKHGCYEKFHKPHYNKKVIALICPEFLGADYAQMLTYMEELVEKMGDTLLVSAHNFSSKTQNKLLDYYMGYSQVDGIIVIEPVAKIKTGQSRVPVVQIGMNNESASAHCVDIDCSEALKTAVKYLLDHGHKKVGFIGEQNTLNELEQVRRACADELMLSDEHTFITDSRFCTCGYEGAEKLLSQKDRPSVVFTPYNDIAVGVIQRLHEQGMDIPEDISLICMDDLALLSDIQNLTHFTKPLSCIKLHLDVLCSEAVHLLYRSMENKMDKTKQIITVTRKFSPGETVAELGE